MTAQSKHRIVRRALLASVAMAVYATTASATPSITPPGGVYTCAWIAANPTAATNARVSCSADMVNPGSALTLRDVPPVRPDASGEQIIPSPTTCVHQGVYAATTPEYTTAWSWGATVIQPFAWYIKHTDGSVFDHGVSQGGAGAQQVAGNIYYFQAQNNGPACQQWVVDYS